MENKLFCYLEFVVDSKTVVGPDNALVRCGFHALKYRLLYSPKHSKQRLVFSQSISSQFFVCLLPVIGRLSCLLDSGDTSVAIVTGQLSNDSQIALNVLFPH